MTTGLEHHEPHVTGASRWRLIGQATLGVFLLATTADAANITRIYDFEDGVIGQTATSLTDAYDEFSFPNAPNGVLGIPSDWIEVGGATPRPLPAGNMKDVVDSVVNIAPALEPFGSGSATYVDATQFGTPAGGWAGISSISSQNFDGFGSPAGALSGSDIFSSNIALRFNGTGGYEDFNTGGGIKGLYIGDDAYANNSPIENGVNVAESFALVSQAWVYPESAGQGTEQVVYQLGSDFGKIIITAEGTWKVDNLRASELAPIDPGTPVVFDEWTHVALIRGGGGATLVINGNVVGSRDGFFNAWPNNVTLGAGDFDESPFTGLIDNFILSGVGDGLGVSLARDFESAYFIEDDISGVQGDVDGDGDVDADDYAIWSDNVGSEFAAGNKITYKQGDIDGPGFVPPNFVAGDGRINFFDFAEIATAARAAAGGGSSTVPEPIGATLAVMGLLAVLAPAKRVR